MSKYDEGKFWDSFLRNINQCMDALQLEQLVKRWTLVYVISPQKKLNKSVRLNLKNEKDRVCLFIEERLDLKDIILPLQLSSSAYGLCEFASV